MSIVLPILDHINTICIVQEHVDECSKYQSAAKKTSVDGIQSGVLSLKGTELNH